MEPILTNTAPPSDGYLPSVAAGPIYFTVDGPPAGCAGCDRCGAHVAAFVRVVLTSGLDLDLCRHHWLAHRDALEPGVDFVLDWTATINARPSTSANAE